MSQMDSYVNFQELKQAKLKSPPFRFFTKHVGVPASGTLSGSTKCVHQPRQLSLANRRMFQDYCVAGSATDIFNILRTDVQVDDLLQNNWTGLQHACQVGRLQTVQALLQSGADPNFKTRDGTTALMTVANSKRNEGRGLLDCVKAVIAAGGDVNAVCVAKMTPLIYAVKRSHVDIVRTFLIHGAKPDFSDFKSRTALHLAAHKGKGKIVRFLLEHGASVISVNKFNETAKDSAIRAGHIKIADIIHLTQVTGFRPGQDPAVLRTINYENQVALLELNMKPALIKKKQFVDEHMSMILKYMQLESLIKTFATHRISYFEFLKCDDKNYIEMGISDAAIREALLKESDAILSSIYTETNPKPLYMHRSLTNIEVSLILANNLSHIKRLSGSLCDSSTYGISKLIQKIKENPNSLVSEAVSIRDLILATNQIVDSCIAYNESVLGFQRLFDQCSSSVKKPFCMLKNLFGY